MSQLQILLHRFPDGHPVPEDFEAVQGPLPELGEGQILCRNEVLSLDPYLRGVISGRQIYAQKLEPGDVMFGTTVAEVVESKAEGFRVGERVVVPGCWQEYAAVNATEARRIDETWGSGSVHLGVLGMPGLTGWAGMAQLAEPKPGDTVVVSAASGPVGSTAGQLAREAGCNVVGIAGGERKCEFVTDELGFDACVDYREGALTAKLKAACPDGIDVYFDNVGGDTLQAVLLNLALGARITLCGLITQYNAAETPPGPNLGPVIGARAIMKGLVVYDFYDRFPEFLQDAGPLVQSGRLKYQEDWTEGLADAPAAFARLMRGENFGKTLVRIADAES
ncbi:MAG: NADP-dependent oxidoreductase [Pseudomonadota bacterium]